MKKYDQFFGLVIALSLLGALLNLSAIRSSAEIGGGWNGGQRVTVGEFAAVRSVTASTATGTALFSASKARPTAMCFNNSAYTVWVGTDANSYAVSDAGPNVLNGFPILSSGTFQLDGSYQGALYVTANANAGAGGANLRCLDRQVNGAQN